MHIIVSHDVDHLEWKEHLKDLIYPKLWVRESINRINGQITFREWGSRLKTTISHKRNNLDELMKFDSENHIPSIFFFGMMNGLGMSYSNKVAFKYMKIAQREGFDIGVHGINYVNLEEMQKEFDIFRNLTGNYPLGIRTHYVRSDSGTFGKLSRIGYAFDSSEFDKKNGYTIKAPYKVGTMWEFPLALMDSYIPYDLDLAKEFTLDVITSLQKQKINFLSILLHDFHFCSGYRIYKEWYEWFILYAVDEGFNFITYEDAIKLLESETENHY